MKSVVLMGDSIRIGYRSVVQQRLADVAEVWGPEDNGRTTVYTLENLNAWLAGRSPDLVHVNCGLHDIHRERGQAATAVPLEEYARNVAAILEALKALPGATVVWALTTPINAQRHRENKPFDRDEANVVAFNDAARRVAEQRGVPVDDLFSVVEAHGRDPLLRADGVHFTDEGYNLLGTHVAGFIRRLL